VLRILQENTAPRFVASRNGWFLKNAIVFRADELRQVANIGGGTSPESFQFAGNAWQCEDQADVRRLVQLPVAETDGIYDARLTLANPQRGDIRIEGRNESDPGARVDAREE
jgi:hypothetical protein